MKNLYKLHYELDDIEPNIQEVIDFINTPLDVTNPTKLIEDREKGRLLLAVASKCFLTADYYHKRHNSRAGEEYALYSSLKEYLIMIKKDLENTLLIIANTINYYKQERYGS